MDKRVYSTVYKSARQQDSERVRQFIRDIQNDLSGAPFLLNLFAPRGFGKTAFLEQIWDEYERVMPASLARMLCLRQKDSEDISVRDLLVDIIRDLGEGLPRKIALPSDYEEFTNDKQLAKLLLSLISDAKGYEKTALLLFDDYDSMPEEQRRWFQENVLSPATRTGKVAVVLSSETEMRFTESFELRMRLECRELTGLDAEAISRALPQYREIAGEIHRITGGLPLLTEEFVEQLDGSWYQSSADFRAHAQEFTGKYYRTYVEERFLADLAPDMRETVLTLALLRRFDVKVLKKIMPDLLPEPYHSYGTADYLDLIDRLRPWVEWRRQGGYTLNPALRSMLEGYVLIIRPDLYERVHRTAGVLYQAWLESEYREQYLVELSYHVLALYRAEEGYALFPLQDEMSQIRVSDTLLKYLTVDGVHRVQAADLDSLRNSLQQDSDLNHFISEDVEDTIRALIDRKIEETAQRKIIDLSSR